jgi:hypothetical protein
MDIFSLFRVHVPREKLQPCGFINSYGEFSSIESSNRYFTPVRDCGPKEKCIPFSSEIDPHGILSKMENMNYIHIDNNEVEYYECSHLDSGELR